MGQKVHPNGIRLGITKPWSSTWYANTKDYPRLSWLVTLKFVSI